MAEALGLLDTALAITDVVQRLYSYISAVKSARDEIRKLTQELFALKGALGHFDVQNKAGLGPHLDEEVQGMLKMTRDTLDTIQKELDPPGNALGRSVQSLKWPFRSGDIESIWRQLRGQRHGSSWLLCTTRPILPPQYMLRSSICHRLCTRI